MQRFILGQKNNITWISAVLIIIGFVSELGFHNEEIAFWSWAIASVLGIIPIAIQAFQALKVKVISIDVLVT
ncbi:MAG TPA: heavy metal translocating P-type ATPase, partial [Clostridiales bacterium]|nr:heavy metal translocating P-type ATPase [Clostridiales bacterium]